ncbi:MAG TPA: type II secretion system F family protein [Acidobacteriota bacterium]|nr:type II secretion system F family protein [Acidobacteriota bacterium]HQF86744.1 type II secretion system F family protein [Acidobacteriota bacterium]HQG91458.1 type II secretion system F family protein [Acidobacteriota bacterium]
MNEVTYSRRLAVCMTAGVPVAEVAAVLARDDPADAVARDLAVRLAAGEPLAGALRRHPERFPAFFIALVEAGEFSGNLDGCLAGGAAELARAAAVEHRLERSWQLPGTRRRLMRLAAIARYCARLALLVDAGVPVVEAFSIIAASVADASIRSSLLAARQAIEITGSLARCREPLPPPLLWQVLNLGSLSSTFTTILREMGACYEAELTLRLGARGAARERRICAAVFVRKFAALFRCGVPVITILELLAGEDDVSPRVREALARPPADRGYRLTDLLARTGLFDEWHLDALDMAETAGRLDDGLSDLADILSYPDEATSVGSVRKAAFLSRWALDPGRIALRVFGVSNQSFSRLLAGRGLSALDAAILDAGETGLDRAAALSAVAGLHTLYGELPDTVQADDCCFLAGWAAACRMGLAVDAALALLEGELPRMAASIQSIRHAIGGESIRLTPKRLVRAGLAPWLAVGIAAGAAVGVLGDALERLAACERIRLCRRRAPLLRGGPDRRRAALTHATRVLGTLLGLGAPIEEALDATASCSGDRSTDQAFRRVYLAVARGMSLSRAVAAEPVFPPLFAAWVGWGEIAGALDAHLLKIADLYEAEMERR